MRPDELALKIGLRACNLDRGGVTSVMMIININDENKQENLS